MGGGSEMAEMAKKQQPALKDFRQDIFLPIIHGQLQTLFFLNKYSNYPIFPTTKSTYK
jgi:hypothetical protein